MVDIILHNWDQVLPLPAAATFRWDRGLLAWAREQWAAQSPSRRLCILTMVTTTFRNTTQAKSIATLRDRANKPLLPPHRSESHSKF